ncbi:MAG: RNA polymerase subunit sigma-24 [Acidimicrobiales bacterium]|nr:RNA polymerase subunit sigma-24 [Acidimicrobiales bacterium]
MSRSPVAQVFADAWPQLVATLVRDLGDLALAEDCASDAFVEAAARWGSDGSPDRPAAWLLTTARRKAIDRVRRDQRFADRLPALAERAERGGEPRSHDLVDDQLALIFGCCHPSLAADAQVALTLREVCGLSTGQIASAFLVPPETMAKRLVRAKAKIRAAGVPFTVPEADALAERLDAVLGVVYLIFTEGHASADAAELLRGDLCDEARWLSGLLVDLLPDRPEVAGLAALVAFTDARRASRLADDGSVVLLEDQDRSRWDRGLIAEGERLLQQGWAQGVAGPYLLQAAIAGEHARAAAAADTDWRRIVGLYDLLALVRPSPVVDLNRAAAVAMADGPEAGLALLDELWTAGDLDDYRYLHAARADLLRRLDRHDEATLAYDAALARTPEGPERAFLAARRAQLGR